MATALPIQTQRVHGLGIGAFGVIPDHNPTLADLALEKLVEGIGEFGHVGGEVKGVVVLPSGRDSWMCSRAVSCGKSRHP